MNFDKVDSKLERLDERLDSIDKHLAVYNQQLIEHIRRTELLENELKPIKKHVDVVTVLLKLVPAVAAFALTVIGIIKYFID